MIVPINLSLSFSLEIQGQFDLRTLSHPPAKYGPKLRLCFFEVSDFSLLLSIRVVTKIDIRG